MTTSRATPELRTTYRYKCVDCRTKNTTDQPAEDNILNCSRCGYATVQVLEGVKHTTRRGRA